MRTTLLTQIQEGADCDLFISAAQKQMDTLDESGGLLEGSRVDLLENKVALAVPDGNPKGIKSFDQLAELLKAGDVMLAMGNSDVPVGQYTQKIFAHYGQVIYPAAVLSGSRHPEEAQALLDYLRSEAAGQVFERVGFSPIR